MNNNQYQPANNKKILLTTNSKDHNFARYEFYVVVIVKCLQVEDISDHSTK